MQILLDIAYNMRMPCINIAFKSLENMCEQMRQEDGISEHIAAWETIMTNIASTYGSVGEYGKSDEISLITIKECIQCYRMNALVSNIYSITWNMGECKKKDFPLKHEYHEKEYLNKCLILCQMNKNISKTVTIRNRLESL